MTITTSSMKASMFLRQLEGYTNNISLYDDSDHHDALICHTTTEFSHNPNDGNQ